MFIPFPPRSETTAVPRDDRTLVTLSGRTLSGIPKSSPEFRMDPKSGTTCDCSDSAVVAVLDVVQAAFASFGRWNGPPFAPSIQAFQRQSCCASPSQSWQRDRRGTDSPWTSQCPTLSGAAPSGTSEICSLFGQSTPFSASTLASLYQNESGYVAAYTSSLNTAIAKGYILSADRSSFLAQAQQVQFAS